MALWPFGKSKRPLSTASRPAEVTTNNDNDMSEKIPVSPSGSNLRDINHVSPSTPLRNSTIFPGPDYSGTPGDQALGVDDQPPRQNSVQDITALPGLRKLEASPHLRPIDPDRPVIPYTLNLNRSSAARLTAPASDTSTDPALGSDKSTRTPTLQRKGSKKVNDRKDRVLREENIRAMSAPMQIPKRPAGVNNDLLRRDSKKARRTLSKARPDDPRASNVSLPMVVPSIMSARSEQRGWLVGGMDLLNPRPTVRLSHPASQYQLTTAASARNGANKDKMPAFAQDSAANHRRRIADLADDLDATSLRAVMERDARRQEQKLSEQHERVEKKLRKRAEKNRADEEKQRAEEESRRELQDKTTLQRAWSIERRPVDVVPPTAVHPAFRENLGDPAVSFVPLTPRSMIDDKAASGETHYGRPQDPFADPPEQVTAIPVADLNINDVNVESWSPVQTPLEEPVLHTARAVRLSQGHMSPPNSPLIASPPTTAPSDQVDTQTRRASNITKPAENIRRTSEGSTRRAGTWAAIFRRGGNNSRTSIENPSKRIPTDESFANVSRESMSRQAVPAHLVRQHSSRAGTTGRTQSRFREDLPDVPVSPPDSRMQSPEMSIAAANVASARRTKQKAVPTGPSSPGYGSEQTDAGRMDSPVVSGPQLAEAPLSHSLASVDSEGSWISGRPQRRSTRSTRRLNRYSTGSVSPVSMEVMDNDFTVSYEALPVPDHELFKSLTPGSTSRPVFDAAQQETTRYTSDEQVESVEGMPVRRGTAHYHPTVVHNDPRASSREGLVAQYSAGLPRRRRSSSVSSIDYTPAESSTIQKATSVNYGHKHGHAKTVSAGSAKLLTISKGESRRGTPVSSPRPDQTEFRESCVSI